LSVPGGNISAGETIFNYDSSDAELQHGSFAQKHEEILRDVREGNVHMVLTGHSHRNMIFEVGRYDESQVKNGKYKEPVALAEDANTEYMKPQNIVAVTASGGPLASFLPGGPLICKCRREYDQGFFYEKSEDSDTWGDAPNTQNTKKLYHFQEGESISAHLTVDAESVANYQKGEVAPFDHDYNCSECKMDANDMAQKPARHHPPCGNLLLFDQQEGKVKFKTETSDLNPRKAVFCEQNEIFTGDMVLEDINSEKEFNDWKPETPIDIVSRDPFTYYGYMEFPSTVQYITYQEGLLTDDRGLNSYLVENYEYENSNQVKMKQWIGKDSFRKLMKAAYRKKNLSFTRYHFYNNEIWDREIVMTKSFLGTIGEALTLSGTITEPDRFEGLLVQFKTVPDFKKREDVCGY